MVSAHTTAAPIDHLALYKQFLDAEDDRSGTVVLHHGRVKRPGKQVPAFSQVRLSTLVDDPDAALQRLARDTQAQFGLHQVLLVHRLGTIGARDTVLLAIVSSATRDLSFDACRHLVDVVKREEFIALVELP
ncbi:MAG: molybdenum cofactor biosynthesis protein MoaE [Deferrisomatales bacterium]|nr:molybdenum cofactor biosynthesis protein MoaE [Deferrisomatales bacterium]